MLEKTRLLDLIRNFVIFDDGQKKVPRQHQFAGVKAAQDRNHREKIPLGNNQIPAQRT